MRVFVTGATGFVGSAVVRELLDAGHRVTGLARSDASAEALRAAGAQVHRGALDDPDSLRRGAAAADGVIHTAFIHDFSRHAENCQVDARAIAALGEGLAGSERPLLVTSGTAVLPQGRLGIEADRADPASAPPRAISETAALALLPQRVRAMVLRLPPSVHGAGDHGFVPALIGIARDTGVAAYLGDGSNRWPAVHRADAARLFRLALEHGEAGTCYHGNAEEGIAFREIAAVIGRHLQLPVRSLPAEAAPAQFGWMARFAGRDMPTSSAWTREQLGWQPSGPGLLQELDDAGYFAG
ncbi:SDR family oxidoreductase [Xanthomonas bundabergensis]|uniref:SDR family oxidoreductase n=1 Tax=Xanthomonas bundabergensis TaxID=3160842 RepID=UPI00351121DE